MKIPPVRQHEPVRASWANRVAHALNLLLRIEGRNGIRVKITDQRISIIGPEPPEENEIPAVIIDGPIYAPILPGDAKYTVRGINRQAAVLSNVKPAHGRPVRDDDGPTGKGWCGIWPAKIDDPCAIVIRVDAAGERIAELKLWTERIYTGPCDEGEALNPSAPPPPLPDQTPDDELGGGGGGGAGGVGGVGGVGEPTAP
jgi:hypothetical protein